MKKNKIEFKREEARELRYNKRLSIKELASHYRKSQRTIYRWLTPEDQCDLPDRQNYRKKLNTPKKYPLDIFNRIVELKKELPQRSAPIIQNFLEKEFPTKTPSLSLIRKHVREQGLVSKEKCRKQGYIKFERGKANDLWQIDIAGVQTVGNLEKLYLIAIIDDCSRFIVAAEYFKDQKGTHVIKIIRDAIEAYGRPNQILSDNGTQFRNLLGELGTKYSNLLKALDIEPVFAAPNHPQTKGKLERWFGTVKQRFLLEARHAINNESPCSLSEFNQEFRKWIDWYNREKFHRSLPENCTPAKIFLEIQDRVFRPLQAKVNWDRWLQEVEKRKVNKYNEIHYKSQKFMVPPGYSGSYIEVMEYEDRLEFYFREKLIVTHPYNISIVQERKKRKITASGTISYHGKHYTIDYKLSGKTVEVQEINNGKNLLVYLNEVLLKTLNL